MSQFLLINQIFVFLITGLGLWLAFWVLFTDRKVRLNQTFFIMTIFILLWVIFAYLGFSATQAKSSLIWYRLNYGAVSMFFIAAYFFSIYFPKKIIESYFLNKIVVCLGSILFFLSIFTDLIIKNTTLKEWGMEIIFGKGNFFYFSIVILLTFLILYFFFKKYLVFSKEERLKVQYFLIGVSIFALMNIIFNVIFPFFFGTIRLYPFGDYSAIFLLGFTAYAIVRKELFGIKVVLTTLLVGLIAILLALDLFVFTPQLWLQIIKGIILAVFLVFGYSLIRSVLKEIKYREQLQEAYQKLQKLDMAKSEFISIASHQLRTPLTAIKGYISMLLEGSYGALSGKIKEKMENIFQSNERLIKLVNDLLSVSRIEAGRIEMELQKVSLEEVISGVIEELKIGAKKKNIYLKYQESEKPLPKILIDRDKIRQVILNVMDNAIRYTEHGGVTVNVKCQIPNVKNKGKIIIEVKDTGAGLTKYEISKMFESFSRGAAGTRLYTEGVGLGLYIAKKFVEMHKGKIWAESKGKGKGSTFYIELPLK